MKNRFIYLISIIYLITATTLFAQTKRYEVKSAVINYKITGSGSMMGMPTKLSGNKTLYFKNNGAIELSKEQRVQMIMGQEEKEDEIVKFDNGVIYSVDEEEKVIYKQTISKEQETIYFNQDGEKGLKSLGGVKVGSEKIAGYKCDMWDLSGVSMCIYKGIPLKIETETMGIIETQIATKVQLNISIDENKFKLPNYPIRTIKDIMEENQKQMEDLSPEQQKMMEEMMKSMGEMFDPEK